MSQQQHNHRNKKKRNHSNKKSTQRNQRSNNKERNYKKVSMRYQIQNLKETNTVELKYTHMDGAVDITKLNIYEDGSDEEFLKLVKEFQNYIDTYMSGKMSMPLTPFTKISAVVLLEQLEICGIRLTSLMKIKTEMNLPLMNI
jgi:hypothetical protein